MDQLVQNGNSVDSSGPGSFVVVEISEGLTPTLDGNQLNSKIMSDVDSESEGRLRTIGFIEAIRSHRSLWDPDDKLYRDTNNKEHIWTEIAKEHGYSNSGQARMAWKRLRDVHRHSIKRRKYRSLEPWKYELQMEFILPYTTRRKKEDLYDKIYNISDVSKSEWNWQDEEPLKKIKKQDKKPIETAVAPEELPIAQLPPETTHTDNLKRFFDNMYENTKVLPFLMQLEVKHNIFEVVSKAEKHYYTQMKVETSTIIGPDRDQKPGISKADMSNESVNVIEKISDNERCVIIKSELESDGSNDTD